MELKWQRKICFDDLSRRSGVKGTREQTDGSWGHTDPSFLICPELPQTSTGFRELLLGEYKVIIQEKIQRVSQK